MVEGNWRKKESKEASWGEVWGGDNEKRLRNAALTQAPSFFRGQIREVRE